MSVVVVATAGFSGRSYSRTWKGEGACLEVRQSTCPASLEFDGRQVEAFHTLIEYQSLRVKGSTVFFLRPFLPFDNLLFLS